MSRLADRILRNGFTLPQKLAQSETPNNLREMKRVLLDYIERAEIILADNVADYLYEGTSQEEWDISKDFPCLAPPFPVFFIEYKFPQRSISKMFGTLEFASQFLECGALCVAQEVPERDKKALRGARWMQSWNLFIEDRDNIHWLAEYVGPTDNDGRIIEYPSGRYGIWKTPTIPLGTALNVPFLTVSFLHCKNVQYIQSRQEPKIARAYQKRHSRPLVRFHTLEIEPMKRILKTEGQSETLGLKRALHICRGHFKDYREHGLFGKIHGIYWWDSFVRGSSESGITLKDYNVNPPETLDSP